jgi:hypothetical protein
MKNLRLTQHQSFFVQFFCVMFRYRKEISPMGRFGVLHNNIGIWARVLQLSAIVFAVAIAGASYAYTLGAVSADRNSITVVYGNWDQTQFMLEAGVTDEPASISWTVSGVPTGAQGSFSEVVVVDVDDDDVDDIVRTTLFIDQTPGTSGPDVGSYDLTVVATTPSGSQQKTLTLVIDKRPVTITGDFEVQTKVYDGLFSATISSSSLGLEAFDPDGNLDRGRLERDSLSLAPVATLNSKDAGSRTANLLQSSLTGDDSSNYELEFTGAPTATGQISQRALLVTGLTFSKVYDGELEISPSGTPAIAGGVIDGDPTPTISGTPSWTLSDPNVGSNKQVTVSANAYSLSDSNYFVAQSTLSTGEVTPASLTVNFSIGSRPYDGTTDVTSQTSVVGFTGLAASDSALTATFESATAADQNIGTHLVTISGLTLDDAQALLNYTFQAQSGLTVVISQKELTLGGSFTANSRDYDGTLSAVGDTSNLILQGVVGSEDVIFENVVFEFDSANRGSRTVSIQSFSLSGDDSANYSASLVGSPTASATIDSFELTVTITVNSKVYDGTKNANVTCTANTFADGLNVSANCSGAQFDGDGSVVMSGGVPQAQLVNIDLVTLANNSLGNYSIPEISFTGQGVITQKTLLITGVTGVDRLYNGTTDAVVTGTPEIASGQIVVLDGVTDDVTLDASSAQYSFLDKIAGTNKPITATGIQLLGIDAPNYKATLSGASATITSRDATFTVSHPGKVYDATTNVDLDDVTLNVVGVPPGDGSPGAIIGDTVTASFTGAQFDSAAAGTRTLTVTGITLSGADAANYTFDTSASNESIVIAKKEITVDNPRFTFSGSSSGTATFQTSGTVQVCDDGGFNCTGDRIDLTVNGNFAEKYVHSGPFSWTDSISVTGADKDNYSYTLPSSPMTGEIRRKTLTISGLTAAASKVYDGNDDASSLISGTPTLSGVVDGSPSLVGSGIYTFSSEFVGNEIFVSTTGFSLNGQDLDGDGTDEYSLYLPRWDRSITSRELTVSGSFEANDKIYDRNTVASFKNGTETSLTLVGIQGSDSVSISNPEIRFASANANEDTPTAVSLTGASLSNSGNMGGDASPEYVLSLVGAPTTTATISRKDLDSTLRLTIDTKTYDGTTAATFSSGPSVTPLSGDTVTVQAGAVATFQTRTAGNGKSVDIQGLQLTGAQAANYTLTSSRTAFRTANINKRTLTVTGITSPGKIYDRTTAAPKRLSGGDPCLQDQGATCVVDDLSATLVDVQQNSDQIADDVSLDTAGGQFTFNLSSAETSRTLTGSGYLLTGADASNYLLTQPQLTSIAIAKKPVTISATGTSRIYNGTSNASVTFSIAGLVSPDSFTINSTSRVFDGPNGRDVGNDKPITVSGLSISGGQSANYTLDGQTTATTSASITPFALTLTATAADKVYDGDDVAQATCTVNRFVIGGTPDDVAADCSSAAFDSEDVARNDSGLEIARPVSITGITLTGDDAANYSIASTSANTSAKILAKPLVASGFTPQDKVYDGGRGAIFDITAAALNGFVGSDSFIFSSVGGLFATSDVVFSGGQVADQNVRLNSWTFSGATAEVTNNYTIDIDNSTTQAKITPKPLTVTITGPTRVYDATTNATLSATFSSSDLFSGDRDAGEVVASATGAFVDKNVGNGKTINVATSALTGTRASNYAIQAPATTLGNITPATLSFTVTATSKTYDGNDSATVSVSDNRRSGDDFEVSYADARFISAAAGSNKTVTVTGLNITGTDADNYTYSTSRTTQANIAARQIAVTGTFTAAPKTYDRSTVATVDDTSGLTLGNIVAGEETNLSIASTTAVFNSNAAGSAKTVTLTALGISGPTAANYTVNVSGVTPYTGGVINPRPLTPTITINSRLFDGTTAATIGSIGVSPIAGDTVSVDVASASAEFLTPDQGTAKEVAVSDIALTGASAANYTIAPTATAAANITGAQVTATASAENKVYNNSDLATVTLTLTGLDPSANDVSVIFSTALFAQAGAGDGITVTVSGLELTGPDAAFYALASTTVTTTANILEREVTITGQSRIYDGTTDASVIMTGVIPGDTVSLVPTAGTFADKNVGENKAISLTSPTLTGDDSSNYKLPDSLNPQGDIEPRALAVQFTPVEELTQPEESVDVTSTDDRVEDDVLEVEHTSASAVRIADELVLQVSGISLSGVDAPNYVLEPTFSSVLLSLPPIQAQSFPAPAPAPVVTPSPTPTPSVTPAPTPSASPSPSPSPSVTQTPRPSASPTASATPRPEPSASASPTSTSRPQATASPSPTSNVDPAPTPSQSPTTTSSAAPPALENRDVGDGLSSWLTTPPTVETSVDPEIPAGPAVRFDTGGEVKFTESGALDLSSVKSVTPQELSNELIAGFTPGASLSIEVLGARTGARFVATTASIIDSATLIEAMRASIPTQAADFFRLDSVSAGTPPSDLASWTEEEQLVAYDYFQASGLELPINVSDLNVNEYQDWISVAASANGYAPGSRVFLTLTSTPLVISEGTVNREGLIELTGSFPVEFLEAGEHRVRLVGIREVGGVSVDENGEIVIPESTMREIERFDLGTQATVRMGGLTPEGDYLNAIRVVPLNPVAPWWTLWFILAGFIISVLAIRRNWTNTKTKYWLTISLNIAVAVPALVIGWLSTVTLVSWVGIALGFIAAGLALVVRPTREQANRS